MRKTIPPSSRARAIESRPRAPRVGETPTASEPRARKPTERARKAQFIEPARLSDAGRALLIERLDRHSIGDPESRELFAAAVEYAIASARPKTKQAVEDTAPTCARPQDTASARPPIATSALAALTAAATELERCLRALDEPTVDVLLAELRACDPFDRAHDRAYLEALARELKRLEQTAARVRSVASSQVRADPASVERSPALDASARRLVARLADAYVACFEIKSPAVAQSAFVPILRCVAEQAGIVLPDSDQALRAALAP